ncbi:sensor histidine kinase [Paenibacillus psychroresistens]|uniref:sensor histidine kinase n=1 Tax=Paenibacillus psychroresistens TaxID=1778678 RepID=UPI001D04644D|nr:HAMP domain-containing sensor histidine kinase [Paenibacillus psychroresistens]
MRLRYKVLYLFVLCSVFSIGTVAVLFLVAGSTYQGNIPIVNLLIRWLGNTIGLPITLSITAIVLFVFFLFVLSHSSIRYLLQITRGLEQIASGNFGFRIPIQSRDELGALADNINKMTIQLKLSMDEERRAEQTKTELITNVSHDLRTPLTSIVGYLGLIEQDRYRDEVELRQYVQIAYEKSLRMKSLINDLFEYTRTSGGMQLKLSPLNLVEMLGQLAAHFRYQLERSSMECFLDFPEKHLIISADGDKLVRVFENLIVNAIQYGHKGKRLDIMARSDGSQAVVEIVNYGEPLLASSIPFLFERFYREEHSRSQNTGGSGLGLAIAKNIVELHNGIITVYSDESRTSFEIRLPIRK